MRIVEDWGWKIKICPVPDRCPRVWTPEPSRRRRPDDSLDKDIAKDSSLSDCGSVTAAFVKVGLDDLRRSAVQPILEHGHVEDFALSKNSTVQGSKKRTFLTLVK